MTFIESGKFNNCFDRHSTRRVVCGQPINSRGWILSPPEYTLRAAYIKALLSTYYLGV